jgi:PAS domain S-box-containing protein
MERLLTGILRQSSDAVVIIGLADGRVLDVNEAFFTATGHARQELVGRPGRDVFLGLGQTADPTAAEVLQGLGSFVMSRPACGTGRKSYVSGICRRWYSSRRVGVTRSA